MPNPSLLLKLALIVGAVVLFLLFRISNIEYRCDPRISGISYCRLKDVPPSFLEGTAALIPENFQVQVGSKVAVLIPRLITLEESTRAAELASQIYQKMSRDPKWVFIQSSLGLSYERMLRFQSTPNQYYVYIPERTADETLPVMLFLHGYGGNFTSYFYLLAQAAEAAGFAIVAPTYGQGNWDGDSIPFVQDVLQEASNRFNLDSSRITLMGISNGGLILANYISALGTNVRNVVFLSTYIELGQYTAEPVLNVLKTVNTVKIIYGENDTHIDANTIPTKVQRLSEQGVNIYYSRIPAEDHFLFFSQPDPVLQDLLSLNY